MSSLAFLAAISTQFAIGAWAQGPISSALSSVLETVTISYITETLTLLGQEDVVTVYVQETAYATVYDLGSPATDVATVDGSSPTTTGDLFTVQTGAVVQNPYLLRPLAILTITDGLIFNFQIGPAPTDAASTTFDLVQFDASTTEAPLDLAATDAPSIDSGATISDGLQAEAITTTADFVPQDPSVTDTPLDPAATDTPVDAGATTTADVVLQDPSTTEVVSDPITTDLPADSQDLQAVPTTTGDSNVQTDLAITDGSLPTDVPLGNWATTDEAFAGAPTTTDPTVESACCSSTQEGSFWTTVPVINLESFVFNFQNPAATGDPSPQPTDPSLVTITTTGDFTEDPTPQTTDSLSVVTIALDASPTDQATMTDVTLSTVASDTSAPTNVAPIRRDFDRTVRAVSDWFETLVNGRKSKRQRQQEIKSSILSKRGKSRLPGSTALAVKAAGVPALDPITHKAIPIAVKDFYADEVKVRSNDNTPLKRDAQTARYQKQSIPPSYPGSASLENTNQGYATDKGAPHRNPGTPLDKSVGIAPHRDSTLPHTASSKGRNPQVVNSYGPPSDFGFVSPTKHSGPKSPDIKVVVYPKISGAKERTKPEVRLVYVPKPKIQLFGRLHQNQRRVEG